MSASKFLLDLLRTLPGPNAPEREVQAWLKSKAGAWDALAEAAYERGDYDEATDAWRSAASAWRDLADRMTTRPY